MYSVSMKERTTIQIEAATLRRLKKLRKYKKETYDEILNWLIDILRWKNERGKPKRYD